MTPRHAINTVSVGVTGREGFDNGRGGINELCVIDGEGGGGGGAEEAYVPVAPVGVPQ